MIRSDSHPINQSINQGLTPVQSIHFMLTICQTKFQILHCNGTNRRAPKMQIPFTWNSRQAKTNTQSTRKISNSIWTPVCYLFWKYSSLVSELISVNSCVIVFQGACILNMLRDFLTPEAFKIGIVLYLRRYSYQNTVNSHLWESLTNVSVYTATWASYPFHTTESNPTKPIMCVS